MPDSELIGGKRPEAIHKMMEMAGSVSVQCDSEEAAKEIAIKIKNLAFGGITPIAWNLHKDGRATFKAG